MILATYQPYIRRPEKFLNKWKEVREYIGFEPIFCFAADTAEDAIIGSILTIPSNPEKLILFEASEVLPVDIVKWNQWCSDNNSVPLFECFNGEAKYKEYIVPQISNIIEEVDVKQAFFDNYKPADFSNPFANLLFQLAKQAKEDAETLSKQFGVEIDQDKHWIEYSIAEKRQLKEIFQYTFLPLLYPAVTGSNFLESNRFSFEQFLSMQVSRDIAAFYDKNNKNAKAINFFENIYTRLQICTAETYLSTMEDKKAQRISNKINPNAPCPCGSGKKYKKCCKGRL